MKRLNLFARLRVSALCRRDAPLTTAGEVIGWWESRRIPFNLIVGTTGVITCIVGVVVSEASSILFGIDSGLPDPPIFGLIAIFIYGIMANICFTGGWVAELVGRKFWPHEADKAATLSFTLGLAFSVLLTLTPGILIGAAAIFGFLRHYFGTH
jgi:hypothetical protein